ncbi:MAG: hypothetical protein ABFS86_14355 [Planctomycetota bacterium]
MKWAVAALVLFVLAALLFGPGGDEPPVRPEAPPVESDVEPPPGSVPSVVGDPDPAAGDPASAGAPSAFASREPRPAPADRLIRLVAAKTGVEIRDPYDLTFSWDEGRASVRGFRLSADGWLYLPRYGRDTGRSRKVVIRLPRYQPVTVDLLRTARRRVIELTPITPSATGRLRIGKGSTVRAVSVRVRSLRGASAEDSRELTVSRDGTEFRLFELPAGEWTMEITATIDGAVVSAKREISHDGGTLDLGEIDLTPWAGIRARIVDADGEVVPQAVIRMCREEEDETKARTGTTDDDGWSAFRDFEPGMWHRVTAVGLPGPLSKLVLAPEKRGDVESVELVWPDRLVPCELRLSLDVDEDERVTGYSGPVNVWPLVSRVPEKASVRLLPGEYTWTFKLEKDGEARTLTAKLVVPAADSHEATLRFE